MSSPRANDWQRPERVARYVKGCPDTGIMFEQTHCAKRQWLGRRQEHEDECVSCEIRCGQHLLRSWSTDLTVIAMSCGEVELYAACTAAQQIIGTENMARELAVHLDAMELQVGAIGIIGSLGFGELGHLDLSCLWLQSAVRRNRST